MISNSKNSILSMKLILEMGLFILSMSSYLPLIVIIFYFTPIHNRIYFMDTFIGIIFALVINMSISFFKKRSIFQDEKKLLSYITIILIPLENVVKYLKTIFWSGIVLYSISILIISITYKTNNFFQILVCIIFSILIIIALIFTYNFCYVRLMGELKKIKNLEAQNKEIN